MKKYPCRNADSGIPRAVKDMYSQPRVTIFGAIILLFLA
jgi:hypothetical protein